MRATPDVALNDLLKLVAVLEQCLCRLLVQWVFRIGVLWVRGMSATEG